MRLIDLVLSIDLDAQVPEQVIGLHVGATFTPLASGDEDVAEHALFLVADALARAELLARVPGEDAPTTTEQSESAR